jgi:hypothetical protein
VLGFNSERALWRESVALFELEIGKRSPESFDLLSQLVQEGFLERQLQYRYLALGLATEKGQAANVTLWRFERMPFPLEYLDNSNAVSNLREALDLAQKVANVLNLGRDWLAWLWVKVKSGPDAPNYLTHSFDQWHKSKLYRDRDKERDFKALCERLPVERDYWWRLDEPFRKHLSELATDDLDSAEQALASWRTELRRAATTAWISLIGLLESSPRALSVTARSGEVFKKQLNIALKAKGGSHDS